MENKKGEIREDELMVMLGVFSGRQNPVLNLGRDDAEKLARMVHAVIGKEPIHPPPPPKLGLFYGFFLKAPRELAKNLELPEKMRVFHGVLTEEHVREEKHWRDFENIERFLTTYAFEKGFGKFLEPVGVKSPRNEPPLANNPVTA